MKRSQWAGVVDLNLGVVDFLRGFSGFKSGLGELHKWNSGHEFKGGGNFLVQIADASLAQSAAFSAPGLAGGLSHRDFGWKRQSSATKLSMSRTSKYVKTWNCPATQKPWAMVDPPLGIFAIEPSDCQQPATYCALQGRTCDLFSSSFLVSVLRQGKTSGHVWKRNNRQLESGG